MKITKKIFEVWIKTDDEDYVDYVVEDDLVNYIETKQAEVRVCKVHYRDFVEEDECEVNELREKLDRIYSRVDDISSMLHDIDYELSYIQDDADY